MWLLYAGAIFPSAFFHLFFIPDQPRADPDQGRKDFVTIVAPILFIILPLVAIYQLTVLVVPPGLANPRGEIVLIKQLPQTMFIDSPTALCARLAPDLQDCPKTMLKTLYMKSMPLLRLPYSKTIASFGL